MSFFFFLVPSFPFFLAALVFFLLWKAYAYSKEHLPTFTFDARSITLDMKYNIPFRISFSELDIVGYFVTYKEAAKYYWDHYTGPWGEVDWSRSGNVAFVRGKTTEPPYLWTGSFDEPAAHTPGPFIHLKGANFRYLFAVAATPETCRELAAAFEQFKQGTVVK